MKRFLGAFTALVLFLSSFSLLVKASNDRQYLLDTISRLEMSEIPKTPQGVHHYLLICMDKWQNNPDNPGYNDGLVLLTLDELSGRIIITSLIRDMLVIRPDGFPGRINRIVRQFGVNALLETINRHFGLEVDKYILMDWRHIMEILDAVGGVDVRLTSDEIHYLKNWAVPARSTQPELSKPGEYHLNGFAAVIYMRIRRYRASNDLDTNDFGRTFRARNVFSSIAERLSKSADFYSSQQLLTTILGIWNQPFDQNYAYSGILNNHIFTVGATPKDPGSRRASTNISMSEFIEALRIAFALRNSKVEQCRLPFDGTVKPFTYASSAGQLLDFKANRELLHEFMFTDSYIVSEEVLP